MKKIVKRFVASIMMALTMLCAIPFGNIKAEAATVNYKQTQRFVDVKVEVKATSNYYFDKYKLNSTLYVANCISKGTVIGNVYCTGVVSQSTTYRSNTVLGSTNYGNTWGDAVNVAITMVPNSSISVKQYIGTGYNMSNASVWGAGSTFKYYVASEVLNNYISTTAPSTKYGFLSNWSPKYNQSSGSWSTTKYGLKTGEAGNDFYRATTLVAGDDFVDCKDYSLQSGGLYSVQYDYIKYNEVGYSSADRRETVFGETTVYNSMEYRAVKSSLGLTKTMYVNPSFTVCDSKSWPTEIKGFSATGSIQIKF